MSLLKFKLDMCPHLNVFSALDTSKYPITKIREMLMPTIFS